MPIKKRKQQEAPPVKRDRNGLVRCRVCGCTEVDACAPGCSWVDSSLCSVCDEVIDALGVWFCDSRRPNVTALLREVRRELVEVRDAE
jgi:hypothetical protein